MSVTVRNRRGELVAVDTYSATEAKNDASRRTLILLIPRLDELRVLDNSADADPEAGHLPRPVELLHRRDGEIVVLADPRRMPEWAKPIVAAAILRVSG